MSYHGYETKNRAGKRRRGGEQRGVHVERVEPTAPMLRTETHIRRDGLSTTTKSELVDHGDGRPVLKKQRKRKGRVAKDKTEGRQTEVLSFTSPCTS